MTPMHLALLDSDDRQRLPLKRSLIQHGFSVADSADLGHLHSHIERHYADSSGMGAAPLVVLLRGLLFSSEFVEKTLPAMRRAYPMVIAIQCPEDPELRVQLFDSGADLCLSDRCSVEELSANLWAQSRRLPERCELPPYSSAAYPGSATGACTSNPVPLNVPVIQDRLAPYQTHSPVYMGRGASGAGAGMHADVSLLPDARLAEASAELQRKVYGTWILAHEDWILVNPLGAHIGLTGVERRCLTQLADNERREFPRHLGTDAGRSHFKSMSVVVSRMRKKVNRSGVPLPLHTVHGMGYVFIGKLIRKPAA